MEHANRPKVFGIGIHKTGLTSCANAMRTMGYRSVIQGLNPFQWANIDAYEFANDMPVDLRYKRLHYLYPDAKFILTMRNFDAWIDSANRHARACEADPSLSWNGEDQVAAYGVPFPTKAMLAERYHRHVHEVYAFFEAKVAEGTFNFPKQFLKFNCAAGDGWQKLCPFLGIDPKIYDVAPFPHLNVGVGK